jgi:hypothetical protein
VTHRAPENAAAAVEIPTAIKRLLGLDAARSWVIVSEGDQFVWPGYDLRKTRGSDRYDYGFLPPRFFLANPGRFPRLAPKRQGATHRPLKLPGTFVSDARRISS